MAVKHWAVFQVSLNVKRSKAFKAVHYRNQTSHAQCGWQIDSVNSHPSMNRKCFAQRLSK
ncbi:hypothetical protein SAMN05444141_104383 [Pseudovibrio denitrificans]|uniref:Uncharacterized protein n=1 Tax=Pseudovibrio denitrificans TaxID=258256 RepID=A0A1I7BV98_9HYPH|nr:hypothetical protein SAMN05444141_104383 [Pseudovibrio denitrificans]